MVPDSACSTPTLMVSAACTDMAEKPMPATVAAAAKVWRGKPAWGHEKLLRGQVKCARHRQTAVCTPLCKPYATLTKALHFHQSGATNNDRRQTCTRSSPRHAPTKPATAAVADHAAPHSSKRMPPCAPKAALARLLQKMVASPAAAFGTAAPTALELSASVPSAPATPANSHALAHHNI